MKLLTITLIGAACIITQTGCQKSSNGKLGKAKPGISNNKPGGSKVMVEALDYFDLGQIPVDAQVRWNTNSAVVLQRLSFRREVEPRNKDADTTYKAFFQNGRHGYAKDHASFEKSEPKIDDSKPHCIVEFDKAMVDALEQKKEKIIRISSASTWIIESIKSANRKITFKFKPNNLNAIAMTCDDIKVKDFRDDVFGKKMTVLVPEDMNY